MKFIGRKEEIKTLKDLYNTSNYEGILIYGRRRIGKSELIKESLKEETCKKIYFECQKASEEFNAENLSELISTTFLIPKPNFKSMNEVLNFIFEKSINEKIILVIDEYPYIRDNKEILDSIFQNVIDKYKMNSKLKLIVCGSYIDIMEALLSSTNPLYGRFTHKMNIKQMNYLESSLFYPNAKNEDKIAYYSVFGGIPYYNQFIDDSKSVKENIINLIASSNARLLSEAENFLTTELYKLNNANECFLAIASGNRKFTDILNKSHISSSPLLADTLKRLIKMDVIEKVNPINDDSEKKSYYEITERLSSFYYKYIFKRNSYFKIMPSDVFFDEFIKDDFFSSFVPHEFENILKQYLTILNLNHKINPVLYKIGKYYYDDPKNKINGEFDCVTLSKDGYDFYEAKFTNSPIDEKVINEEINQLNKLNIKYNKLGFLSKNGFNIKDSKDYTLITLDDLYNIL